MKPPAIRQLDETHDPGRRSWVASANLSECEFPVQNLPFGVFRRPGESERVGVAIGDRVVDLARLVDAGLFDDLDARVGDACRQSRLNALAALGRSATSAVRRLLSGLLAEGTARPSERGEVERALVPSSDVELVLPVEIGDYTDFYASVFHATNVGRMMRPDSPLLPNYKYVPIGYHGRASSVVVSGTEVRRPSGQTRPEGVAAPLVGPSRRLDYELELAAVVGVGNALGARVPIDRAEEHVVGVCLLNDWSARDMQQWEYQPLGPFLAKNFATSVSPWVVTLEALAPFRVPPFERPGDDPAPLPYLDSERHRAFGGLDVVLEVWMATAAMRERGEAPVRISQSRFRDMYWTLAQLVAHHTSNGCNLRPGDLIASGTVSGPEKSQRGCLLELAWRGTEPVELPSGERRTFLEDGDEVTLRGFASSLGRVRIGLGECRGRVAPPL